MRTRIEPSTSLLWGVNWTTVLHKSLSRFSFFKFLHCPKLFFLFYVKNSFEKQLPQSARRTLSRKRISQCLNDCRTMTAESFPKSQSKGQMWWTQEINAKAVLSLNLFNRQTFLQSEKLWWSGQRQELFFLACRHIAFQNCCSHRNVVSRRLLVPKTFEQSLPL